LTPVKDIFTGVIEFGEVFLGGVVDTGEAT
jgi:hypothetical protein